MCLPPSSGTQKSPEKNRVIYWPNAKKKTILSRSPCTLYGESNADLHGMINRELWWMDKQIKVILLITSRLPKEKRRQFEQQNSGWPKTYSQPPRNPEQHQWEHLLFSLRARECVSPGICGERTPSSRAFIAPWVILMKSPSLWFAKCTRSISEVQGEMHCIPWWYLGVY